MVVMIMMVVMMIMIVDDCGDNDNDSDDGGGGGDDDLPDLVPDSDYEEGDEEFEESLTDHDSDEIAIMYILLPNTNSIHDQPLGQPLYSVFRSHV